MKRVIYGSPYPTKWLPIFHQAAAARDKVKAYNSEYVVFLLERFSKRSEYAYGRRPIRRWAN
jgi:hypothetical protein